MFVFVRADEFVLRYHISRFHMVYGCNIIGRHCLVFDVTIQILLFIEKSRGT